METGIIQENLVLNDVAILASDRFAFCAIFQAALESGNPVSLVLFWDHGEWTEGPILQFEATSLSAINNDLIIIGRRGEAVRVSQTGTVDLPLIGETDNAGPFRSVKNVNGQIYVLGEDRGVFAFEQSGWRPLIAGLPTIDFSEVTDSDEAHAQIMLETGVWFGLAGYSPRQLCAVGTDGEIWHWNGGQWFKAITPTNVLLLAVSTVDNGEYLVCGQRGIVMQGFNDQWDILCVDEPALELCSVALYRRRYYVADGRVLLALEDGRLRPLNLGIVATAASHLIKTDGEVLISVAGKEIWLTRDGVQWQSLLD